MLCLAYVLLVLGLLLGLSRSLQFPRHREYLVRAVPAVVEPLVLPAQLVCHQLTEPEHQTVQERKHQVDRAAHQVPQHPAHPAHIRRLYFLELPQIARRCRSRQHTVLTYHVGRVYPLPNKYTNQVPAYKYNTIKSSSSFPFAALKSRSSPFSTERTM